MAKVAVVELERVATMEEAKGERERERSKDRSVRGAKKREGREERRLSEEQRREQQGGGSRRQKLSSRVECGRTALSFTLEFRWFYLASTASD